MYIYIYIHIGESDSLANYYYIHASNLNQQAFMHRYNMSIIYICTHAFHASVTNRSLYDNDKNIKAFRLEELEQNPKSSHPRIT